MNERPVFSVIIPVFNEEANLPELFQRCLPVCKSIQKPLEIIVVDDGSTDRSEDIIADAAFQNPEVIGVFLNRNYGQHAAVTAGLAEARGEVVVTLDADLQNPPEEIPNLLKKIEQGYDVVGSIRTPRNDSLFRRMSSSFINRIVQLSTGVLMHDYGCMLRAYRRQIVEAMLRCNERSTFIPILANCFARSTTEIEVHHEPRSRGESKYHFWRLINLMFDLLTTMTTIPLRLLTVGGAFISAGGVVLGLFIFLMRIIHGPQWAVGGVFTLFAILFIFIGAQFMGMGILGEYIGRIYNDVRGRPRYFVHRVVGRDRFSAGKDGRASLRGGQQ